MSTAKLNLDGKEYELPIVVGAEDEVGLDISKLRAQSGAVTLDQGYGNTGSCRSAITFVDGENGILRYRGYPIEELAENATFPEVAYLLIYGELPTRDELDAFDQRLKRHSMLHEDMKRFFEGYPNTIHPMAVLASGVASLSASYSGTELDDVDLNIVRLLAKMPSVIAAAYKKSIGQPITYPDNSLSYTENFLHMMFSVPTEEYKVSEVANRALSLLLVLHGDHEQNCSTSTVRMVGSSQANLYASVSAGICALWGPLHGGANQRVVEMLEQIYHDDENTTAKYVEKSKDKSSGFRLMGFGHRVYKNFDPRAKILKKAADDVLEDLGVEDPLLDIAKELERAALEDDFFIERKLYPNVDFYSGIIYRALGIPTNMFTVMFGLGRLPGWIAQWKEGREGASRINRPRQIYTGSTKRDLVPIEKR